MKFNGQDQKMMDKIKTWFYFYLIVFNFFSLLSYFLFCCFLFFTVTILIDHQRFYLAIWMAAVPIEKWCVFSQFLTEPKKWVVKKTEIKLWKSTGFVYSVSMFASCLFYKSFLASVFGVCWNGSVPIELFTVTYSIEYTHKIMLWAFLSKSLYIIKDWEIWLYG